MPEKTSTSKEALILTRNKQSTVKMWMAATLLQAVKDDEVKDEKIRMGYDVARRIVKD